MSVKNWKEYLLQVSLIIVSLFIAFGVERCNQSVKDSRKLDVYLEAARQEIANELRMTINNIGDGEGDAKDLSTALTLLAGNAEAALPEALTRVGTVIRRGVFRTFSPMTYEIMTASGDALLFDDIEILGELSRVSSFRKDYVQHDLMRHDELVLTAVRDLSDYIDILCLRHPPEQLADCIHDPDRFFGEGPGDLSELLLQSEIRNFHLRIYRETLEEVAAKLK